MPAPEHCGPEVPVIGWDIGGAHVKASRLDRGQIVDVGQWAAPLWKGLDHLDRAIVQAFGRWGGLSGHDHAITMTAEMIDLFPDRQSGVASLVARLGERLGERVRFFAAGHGWLASAQAAKHWRSIASANWLASARCVARRHSDAIFIDVGSTTTDIVPVASTSLRADDHGDAARLARRELIYVGVARTPLCALADRIRFGEQEFNVMNELFATTADVYGLTGELDPAHDQHPAADGGAKDDKGRQTRLARMIGHDRQQADARQWRAFALQWRDKAETLIGASLDALLARRSEAPGLIVGAGCGLFVAHRLALRRGIEFLPFHRLFDTDPRHAGWLDTCAPSAAIASLYAEEVRPCG